MSRWSIEKTFTFSYDAGGTTECVSIPVTIPSIAPVTELGGRMIAINRLPPYIQEDLLEQLHNFVELETRQFHDEQADESLTQLTEENVEDIASEWTKRYTQYHGDYARTMAVTNEDVFAEVYHNLIHSPALETLLTLEHTYAVTVGDLIRQRDKALKLIEERQAEEMNHAVQSLGHGFNDREVNQLAARHFENQQLAESKWESEISALKDTQKREYKDFVMNVQEHTQSTTGPAFMQRIRAPSDLAEDERTTHNTTRLEESFTIHLGAQLKTTHNIRLLCADILDLCRHKPNKVGGIIVPQPQRLQTAMSLYSNSLSGLILLVDNRLSSYTGIKRDFARVCEESTEFHFPDLESQFEAIREDALRANDWRASQKTEQNLECVSSNSTLSSASSNSETQEMTIPWCLKRAELVFKCVKGFMIESTSWGGTETSTLQFLVPKEISDEAFVSFSQMLPQVFRVSNPLRLKVTS
ncbi:PREDICTED: protein C12orf4-like [Priapulus caudatus]|uniref:Protein C12orf4-like n=1 Tax=Priapulus caudatus TaxID=37621 RepID=A0ABM1E0G6_PRICU|nr:PREDICTED: protein C12orf4-like [Priapulus caudatus]